VHDSSGTKTCTKCHEELPLSAFKWVRTRNRHESRCKKCLNAAALRRYHANPKPSRAEMRRSHLKRKYGITAEQYEALAESQGRQCAICGTPEAAILASDSGRHLNAGLYVDHCHTTGEIRGLLCVRCNRALGGFQDDPARLRAAARYLLSPPAATTLGKKAA